MTKAEIAADATRVDAEISLIAQGALIVLAAGPLVPEVDPIVLGADPLVPEVDPIALLAQLVMTPGPRLMSDLLAAPHQTPSVQLER